jgi:acyl carrier protein
MAHDDLTPDRIADELESFLREHFQIPPEDAFFTRSVHLWEEGYVDSAGVVETIAFLENRYGVNLPEEVVFNPRFTDVAGMAEVIHQSLKRAA